MRGVGLGAWRTIRFGRGLHDGGVAGCCVPVVGVGVDDAFWDFGLGEEEPVPPSRGEVGGDGGRDWQESLIE